jgi:hypothetical protein
VLPNPSPLVTGAVLAVIFLLLGAIMLSLGVLFKWATRRRLQFNAPRFVLRNAAVTVLGGLGIVIGIVALATLVPNSMVPWVVVPLLAAAFPLFDMAIKPRLLFSRSVDADNLSHDLDTISQWVSETAPSRLGRIRMAVIPGDLLNAFATGIGWPGRWILLGGGLVRHLNASQLRSVVAHELAHQIRRDVPKLIALATVSSIGYLVILRLGIIPLYNAERYIVATMLGGVSAGILLGLTPGLIMQRIELATDKLGAKLTGDPEAACSALTLMASLSRQSIDQGSLTHPPISKRIEALRAAAK